MIIKKRFLKSGSLVSVLFVGLLISIILLNLLFIQHFFLHFSQELDIEERNRIECDNKIKLKLFDNNEELLKWGAYYIYNCNKHNSLEKTVLFGVELGKKIPTLYLPDKNQKLIVTGRTYLKGNIFLPKEGILSQNFNEFEQFSGFYEKNILFSNKELPLIQFSKEKPNNNIKNIKFNDIKSMLSDKNSEFYNSFSQPTVKINSSYNEFDNSVNLSGNIILYSRDSILIKKHTHLENIIIFSPKVRIESGFKGKLQIFSSKSINIGNESKLLYPSFLSVFNDDIDEANIVIGKKSLVIGGVLLYGNESKFDSTRKLYMKSGSEVVGQIYCKGDFSLKGKVTGSVFTKYFFIKSKTTEYKNVIANGKIFPIKETDFGYPAINVIPYYSNEKVFIEEL